MMPPEGNAAAAPQITGAALLARATRTLTEAGIPDAGRDARRLLAHVLGVPPGRLTLFLPEPVSRAQAAAFCTLIDRRAAREPVSHLTGRRLFYGREFLVTPEVLDPRPETEMLVEAALAEPFSSVLDLGTGSGCILLTLLAEREDATGLGTDLSAEALNVAHWNRNAMRLEPRAALAQGDWFGAIVPGAEPFDLIVSNPPYIALSEMSDLAPEVRDHEPRMALTDGADGLAAYASIAKAAPAWLRPGGRLLVEIGPAQAKAVSQMVHGAGLTDIAIIRDLDDRDRVVAARQPA